MVQTAQYFKDKFISGYSLTAQDYTDLVDSFRSVLVGVPLSDTTGLSTTLAAYRKTTDAIATSDITGLTTFVNALLTNFLTSASAIPQSQITGLVDALASYVNTSQVNTLIASGLTSVAPKIGENGNWFVGGTDTGVVAAGAAGVAGTAPTIGENGNWFIGSTDTGVAAVAKQVVNQVDYDVNVAGTRDGKNLIFASQFPYISGTLKIFKNGLRLNRSNTSDYIENSDHLSATIRIAPVSTDVLIFEYVKVGS